METNRITSIDIVRGIVMLLMPLDHLRDLLHIDSLSQSPTDLQTTTPLLFFSRWVTHFCAPVFVFLAGTSAQRHLARQQDVSITRKYLLTRGFYLILLEVLVVNFLLYFDPGFHIQLFEVIAAIGFGFICLAMMLRWNNLVIAAIGLSIVCLHNALSLIPFNEGSIIKQLLSPLFGLTVVPLSADRTLIIAYPPLPWLGIMMLGFALGKLYQMPQSLRLKNLWTMGAIAIALFLILRVLNSYGDPVNWSPQQKPGYTLLSFLNLSKYPPSLLFFLMTLGPMLIGLAYFEKAQNGFTRFTAVFGRVPLFFFLLHFLVIHVLLLVILFAQGFTWPELSFASGNFGRPRDARSGISLAYVLLVWPILLLLLYPICKWFGRFKATRNYWWTAYL